MAPSRGPSNSLHTTAGTSGRASQACAGCKRRKVRCAGGQPCTGCVKHGLACVYTSYHGRSRINAAERGAVISEFRRLDTATSPALAKVAFNTAQEWQCAVPELSLALLGAPFTSTVINSHSLADDVDNFSNVLIPEFMKRVYPLAPILEVFELQGYFVDMAVDTDAAALIYAATGVTLLVIQNDKLWHDQCFDEAQEVITRAINHHSALEFSNARPTLPRILSRLFIGMSMMIMHKNDLAFFYLHQTISLMFLGGLDKFLNDQGRSFPDERARRERIYWLCFIHERHLCISNCTLVCLDPLPNLPAVDTAPEAIGRGWNLTLDTFMIMDHDFARYWSRNRTGVTAEWLRQKHSQINDEIWRTEVSKVPFVQQADLIITRQWLRTLTWQMATSNALLSSDADQLDDGLSLSLPLRLSTQVKDFLGMVSNDAIEVHGIGIMEKLFEITTTIADVVITLMSGEYLKEALNSVHDLFFIKDFLFQLPRLPPLYRDMVEAKMERVRDLVTKAEPLFVE